jgi:hypothetical protein
VIIVTTVISCTAVEQALVGALRAEVSCVPAGDRHRVDTPYVLQDGHLLQVFLWATGENGTVVASDGGYATAQVETFARSVGALRERYADLKAIANALELEWDAEFRFSAPDLDSAARRIAVLARAVDQSLTLVHTRQRRAGGALREQLGRDLREAGLRATRRARIRPHGEERGVMVDYRVQRNGSEGAVEVLGGRTFQGAAISVDRAVATFHILERLQYRGRLFAVYDEDSPAGELELRERFRSAGPRGAMLLPGSEAVPTILDELAG